MLIKIDPILSPDLLFLLRSMGHGDKLVLADANFPANSMNKNVIRLDGVNIKDTAVLSVIGVSELFYMGKSIAGTHYRYTESFVLVALIYLILVLITTRILTIIIQVINREKVSLPKSVTGGLS